MAQVKCDAAPPNEQALLDSDELAIGFMGGFTVPSMYPERWGSQLSLIPLAGACVRPSTQSMLERSQLQDSKLEQ
jgi:hypothetical protein